MLQVEYPLEGAVVTAEEMVLESAIVEATFRRKFDDKNAATRAP